MLIELNSIQLFIAQFFSLLQGLTEFFNTSTLPECDDENSGRKTYQEFYVNLYNKNREDWLQTCPLPCNQTVYDIDLQRYHKYNMPNPILDKDGKLGVMLKLKYETLAVEEQVETLVYDAANFLAQAGGNLGLFLGFSCLSVLICLINLFEKLLSISKQS